MSAAAGDPVSPTLGHADLFAGLGHRVGKLVSGGARNRRGECAAGRPVAFLHMLLQLVREGLHGHLRQFQAAPPLLCVGMPNADQPQQRRPAGKVIRGRQSPSLETELRLVLNLGSWRKAHGLSRRRVEGSGCRRA